jgi:hypothetical protein
MNDDRRTIEDDVRTLHRLGYAGIAAADERLLELAVSLSIICILAGGVTFVPPRPVARRLPDRAGLAARVPVLPRRRRHHGTGTSAFPTAGGLYHWASLLGKGWAGARLVQPRRPRHRPRRHQRRRLPVHRRRSAQPWVRPRNSATVAGISQLVGVCLITATQAVQSPRHPRHVAADRLQRLVDSGRVGGADAAAIGAIGQ